MILELKLTASNIVLGLLVSLKMNSHLMIGLVLSQCDPPSFAHILVSGVSYLLIQP